MTPNEIDAQLRERQGFDPTDRIINSPSFAWDWQCRIAKILMDQGNDMPGANQIARGFMNGAYGVDLHGPPAPK